MKKIFLFLFGIMPIALLDATQLRLQNLPKQPMQSGYFDSIIQNAQNAYDHMVQKTQAQFPELIKAHQETNQQRAQGIECFKTMCKTAASKQMLPHTLNALGVGLVGGCAFRASNDMPSSGLGKLVASTAVLYANLFVIPPFRDKIIKTIYPSLHAQNAESAKSLSSIIVSSAIVLGYLAGGFCVEIAKQFVF